MFSFKLKKVIPIFFILLISFLFYYPAIKFEYVWDDSLLFINNIELLEPNLTWHMISQPVLPGTSYFRPLVFLTWFYEFHYFGQNSYISHSINIIIYMLNLITMYILGILIFSRIKKKNVILCSSLATLLYAIHPALIETTAWVSGRFDLLVTFFTLLGCILYLNKSTNRVLQVVLLNICFFCALMSKELAIVLPVILMFLSFIDGKGGSTTQRIIFFIKSDWVVILSFILSFIIYLILRVESVSHIYHADIGFNYIYNVIIERKMPFYAVSAYFFQALFPFYTISPLHPVENFTIPTVLNILKTLTTLSVLVFVFYKALFRNSAAAWLAMCSLLAIFPVLHVIPLTVNNNLFHERFMTLGLTFFMFSVVSIPYQELLSKVDFLRVSLKELILKLMVALWIFSASFSLYNILPFWKSDLTLWHWMYKTYPKDDMARYSYFLGLLERGYSDKLIHEMDVYKKNHHGLSVQDQIIYANALLSIKNPESFYYLEGIVDVLPKFHEQSQKPREEVLKTQLNLTPLQVAGIYDSMSISYILFKNDLLAGEKYNNISEEYLLPSERFVTSYRKVAILYLLGHKDESLMLYNKLNNSIPGNKLRYSHYVDALVHPYCDKNKNIDVCIDYKVKKSF